MYRRSPEVDVACATALVVSIDQLSKAVVRTSLAICPDGPIEACERVALAGPIGLLRTLNAGSAIGILGSDVLGWLLFGALGLLLVQWSRLRTSQLLGIALGFQIGGLVANLADRVMEGAVTDFIHVRIGGSGQGLIFNPADVGLVIGGIVAGIEMIGRGASARHPPKRQVGTRVARGG